MGNGEPKPWDQAKGESAKAFSHFQVHLQRPPNERTLGKAAEK